MSKKNNLPKKNALGSYEINIDDVSTDDVMADFEKAFHLLDQEAKSSPTKARGSQSVIRSTPLQSEEDSKNSREYTLNTRYALQDHIDMNAPSNLAPKAEKPAPAADWLKQTAAPPAAPKPPVVTVPPQSLAPQPVKRIPPKPRDKPHTKEQMLEDLQDIMMAINAGSNELQRFQAGHPYLIAPNVYGVWSDTLKETSISLMREYQRLRNKDLG